MLFSILIPIYNMEKYLPECLCSITAQDYLDYEIILIDDGSTDDSGKICDDFYAENDVLCKVVHKSNGGLMSARRKAFELAEGEYCICLDSDDLLAEGALAHLAGLISEYKPDFILHDLYLFKKGGSYVNINSGKTPLKEHYKYGDTCVLRENLLSISYNNWSMAAKCIKTSFAQTKYDFTPYYGISYGEDTIQSVVLYNETSSFVYTSRRIYNYRVKSGMTGNANIRYLKDFYQVSRFIKDECGDWCNDIEYRSELYFAMTAIDYIRIAVYSDRGFRSFKKKMYELTCDGEIMAVLGKISDRSENAELKGIYRRLENEKFFNIYTEFLGQRIREFIKNRIK
mgnify:FL=1